jgi:hypothetical protein
MSKIKVLVLIMILTGLTGCQIRSKSGIVISKLSKVSKLSTVEVVLTKYVYDIEELRSFWNRIFGIDKIFLSRTEATVKFGVDLSKIQPEDILIRGTMISMELPPVEVTNFSYPAEQFKIDQDITDINPDKIDETLARTIDKLYQAAELDIWMRLDQLGIHKTVEERTTMLLQNILGNMGFDEIHIKYKAKEPFNPQKFDEILESIKADYGTP